MIFLKGNTMNLVRNKSFSVGLSLLAVLFSGCQNGILPLSNTTSNSSTTGGNVTSNRTINIQASAQDNVGVTKVEFYVNGSLACTILSSPYNCSWNVPQGPGVQYQLQ